MIFPIYEDRLCYNVSMNYLIRNKNRKQRKRGALLLEMLLSFSILAIMAGNYFTKTAGALEKAKWAQARYLQGQLQQTYTNWTQLGGTHPGPIFNTDEPIVGIRRVNRPMHFIDYTINNIEPTNQSGKGRVNMDISCVNPLPTSSEIWKRRIYFIVKQGTPFSQTASSAIAVFTNIEGSEVAKADAVIDTNVNYVIHTYRPHQGAWKANETYLTHIATGDSRRLSGITINLWRLLTATESNTPTSMGEGAWMIKDSENRQINSSSVRLTNINNAEAIRALDENSGMSNCIVYSDEYRIFFEPRSKSTGNWRVEYID